MIRALLFLFPIFTATIAGAQLGHMEQIETETFGKMREVERYQLKIAEKYYLKGEYKIALDEYDMHFPQTLVEHQEQLPLSAIRRKGSRSGQEGRLIIHVDTDPDG